MAVNNSDFTARSDEKATSFVGEEVRRHDRDRFLTALFAPAECREDLWVLYAVNAEIARIRDGVSEPMLGHMKVQWWRDVIAAIREQQGAPVGHPVAQALQQMMHRRILTKTWLAELLAARDEELDKGEIPTLAALEDHAERTAVRVAWLGLELLGVTDAVSRDAARRAALGYALCGVLRAVPFHAARNRLLLPRDLLGQGGITLTGLQSGSHMPALAAVAAEVAARADMHLDLARSLSRMADRRAGSVLLWGTVARSFRKTLARADNNLFDRRVLGFRADVAPLIWASFRRRY
jgi:phytoene synthase